MQVEPQDIIKMKGKNTFTAKEISDLKQLILMRVNADKDDQKKIRRIMRSIGFYGSDYGIVDCQVSDLEGLIRSGMIKVVGGKLVSANAPSATTRPAVTPKATKTVAVAPKAVKGLAAAEKNLLQGDFLSVGALSGDMVPDVPGLYCIKLRKGVRLPAKYGKVREDGVIYIGKADNLRERLWEEELSHKRPATFFRGIGAILDYLPPKGSLIGYANQKNYKFSPEDTSAIIKWMKLSLVVNWIQLTPSLILDTEKELIVKYAPMMNTTHNPHKNKELAAARKRCREYAKSE